MDRNSQKQPAMGLNPKMTFGFLLVLSVVTFGMGIWQIGKAINLPFEKSAQLGQALGTAVSGGGDEAAVISALRVKDSDQDGLSDYDELYTYLTSPYLPDSDSDGASDYAEITKGDDPNCPSGKNCRGVGTSTGSGDTAAPPTDLFSGISESFGFDAEGESASIVDNEALDAALGAGQQEVTPELLRQMLASSGQVDAAMLDEIDDATLMEVYEETVKDTQPVSSGTKTVD